MSPPFEREAGEDIRVMRKASVEQGGWNVQCVIYDCDGVMFDSLEANSRLYNHLSASLGRGPLSEEELRYCHTHTVYEAIHRLFERDPEQEAGALAFLKTVDLKAYISYLIMEPHLVETLVRLRESGIRTAVCTNRTTTMKHIVERFALSPYFDMIVTALDVKRPKPDPEAVEMILAGLGVDRLLSVYVGDSEVDRETARSSGVKFVAYKGGGLPADAVIDDHRSLLSLFLLGGLPR
jgi:phosphoglycolate phosphatase